MMRIIHGGGPLLVNLSKRRTYQNGELIKTENLSKRRTHQNGELSNNGEVSNNGERSNNRLSRECGPTPPAASISNPFRHFAIRLALNRVCVHYRQGKEFERSLIGEPNRPGAAF
jgi:hypothetical protein